MYKSIYVPVDNSDHSNRAIASAVTLGKAFDAKLTGCHVYAAKLHDYRFRQWSTRCRRSTSMTWSSSASGRSTTA